jgi:hypothetical protein
MIKKILITAFFLIVISSLFAQYKPIILGLRVGTSIDWMKPDAEHYSSEGVQTGLAWGLIADFYFMENYSVLTGFNAQYLHGELSFPTTMKLGNETVATAGWLSRTYNLRYIQVPVSLKMQAEVSKKVALFGKIGIGTAFRTRAKADDVFTGEEGETVEKETDISDEVTFMRESFIIGGGTKINLKGSTALIIDITYDGGFGNILKGYNQAYPDVEQKAKLNFVELGVGIVF